jgi:hypothetical protein
VGWYLAEPVPTSATCVVDSAPVNIVRIMTLNPPPFATVYLYA